MWTWLKNWLCCRATGRSAMSGGYVSRKTVQTHLGHVFAKLHITSRAQLAAEATRRRANTAREKHQPAGG